MPDDPLLVRLWPQVAQVIDIDSEPPGARVLARPYDETHAEPGDSDPGSWRAFGSTPIARLRFPKGFARLRLELAGARSWIRQKISFASAYGERMFAYLLLPQRGSAPYPVGGI